VPSVLDGVVRASGQQFRNLEPLVPPAAVCTVRTVQLREHDAPKPIRI
jgi:hypothetical protein